MSGGGRDWSRAKRFRGGGSRGFAARPVVGGVTKAEARAQLAAALAASSGVVVRRVISSSGLAAEHFRLHPEEYVGDPPF